MFELYEPVLVGIRYLWSLLLPRWWLFTFSLGIILTGWNFWHIRTNSLSQVRAEPKSSAVLTIVQPDDQIVVDVSGAVLHPGMYQLNKSARIGQAISRAGGFRPGVDDRSVAKNINLAQKLQDEDKIYIPFESDSASAQSVADRPVTSSIISINSATAAQLESLDGIGEKRAAGIISGRPYQQLRQLVERDILSESVFAQIAAEIGL